MAVVKEFYTDLLLIKNSSTPTNELSNGDTRFEHVLLDLRSEGKFIVSAGFDFFVGSISGNYPGKYTASRVVNCQPNGQGTWAFGFLRDTADYEVRINAVYEVEEEV